MKTDGIILDVDGTLWDSTPIVAGAWTRAVQEGGVKDQIVTADELKSLFGRTMDVIADCLLPQLSPQERYAVMDVCCRYEHEALQKDPCKICYPGVVETIQALSRQVKVFIVSNCQSGYIELFLEKTGLAPYVTDTECFGDTGMKKAENIRLVVERNGLRRPVYVGDTKGDEEAAHAVGVPFVHAAYGFGKAVQPEAVIHAFPELRELDCECTLYKSFPQSEAHKGSFCKRVPTYDAEFAKSRNGGII